MEIRVYCHSCGTELETPDATCGLLLNIGIRVQPCPKCCRPPDCQKTCEDVLNLKQEIEELKKRVPGCFEKYDSKNIPCERCGFKEDCEDAGDWDDDG